VLRLRPLALIELAGNQIAEVGIKFVEHIKEADQGWIGAKYGKSHLCDSSKWTFYYSSVLERLACLPQSCGSYGRVEQ